MTDYTGAITKKDRPTRLVAVESTFAGDTETNVRHAHAALGGEWA